MLNFDHYNWRQRNAQDFDKNTISVKMAGKEYNVYDKIQAGREDTEIYPTLELYGCIDKMMLNTQGIYEDFTKFKELREMKDQQRMANQMFYNLPLDTRQHFNNDLNQFMKDGEKYIQNLIKQEQQTQQTTQQPTAENTEKQNG